MSEEKEKKFVLEIVEDSRSKRVVGTIEVPIDPHCSQKKSKEKERV